MTSEMMIYMIYLVAVILTYILSYQNSPIKMISLIMLISVLLMKVMFLKSASTWFPTIYALLFMGGILIMFMIVSSTLPNMPTNRVKMSKIMIGSTIFPILAMSTLDMKETSIMSLKGMLMGNQVMPMMVVLLILYFFVSMMFISTTEKSMKSVF